MCQVSNRNVPLFVLDSLCQARTPKLRKLEETDLCMEGPVAALVS